MLDILYEDTVNDGVVDLKKDNVEESSEVVVENDDDADKLIDEAIEGSGKDESGDGDASKASDEKSESDLSVADDDVQFAKYFSSAKVMMQQLYNSGADISFIPEFDLDTPLKRMQKIYCIIKRTLKGDQSNSGNLVGDMIIAGTNVMGGYWDGSGGTGVNLKGLSTDIQYKFNTNNSLRGSLKRLNKNFNSDEMQIFGACVTSLIGQVFAGRRRDHGQSVASALL